VRPVRACAAVERGVEKTGERQDAMSTRASATLTASMATSAASRFNSPLTPA
jgi:hypothetical protein